MEAVKFLFRKILVMIFLIILANGLINAQEKPVINQPSQIQEPKVPEPSKSATQVKTTKPKQVKASRPVMSQTRGARPPTIIRPSGSGIPKGTGNPGGALGPGKR